MRVQRFNLCTLALGRIREGGRGCLYILPESRYNTIRLKT